MREHEEICKQKNAHIFFIFRDYDRVPMKIEIALNNNNTVDDLLDHLSAKIKIEKENIELVMIKNHEIIEYVTSYTKKIKFIATHVGFLFGFQKYGESDIPPPQLSSMTKIAK